MLHNNSSVLNVWIIENITNYLFCLDENVVSPMYFDNMASAEQSVRDGETWGILAMDGNFSRNLYDRIIEGDFKIHISFPHIVSALD